MLKVLVVGGGSGGHITPAVAVVREILEQKPRTRVEFYLSRVRIVFGTFLAYCVIFTSRIVWNPFVICFSRVPASQRKTLQTKCKQLGIDSFSLFSNVPGIHYLKSYQPKEVHFLIVSDAFESTQTLPFFHSSHWQTTPSPH